MKNKIILFAVFSSFLLALIVVSCKSDTADMLPNGQVKVSAQALANDSLFIGVLAGLNSANLLFERQKASLLRDEDKAFFKSEFEILVSKAETNTLKEEDLKTWVRLSGYADYQTMVDATLEQKKRVDKLFSKYSALSKYGHNELLRLFEDASKKVKLLPYLSNTSGKLQTRNYESDGSGCRDPYGHQQARNIASGSYLVTSVNCLRWLIVPGYGEVAAVVCEIAATVIYNKSMDLAYRTYCL